MPMNHCVIKKAPQPPQVHHSLLFANSPLKCANCLNPPPLLGKITPNILVFYAPTNQKKKTYYDFLPLTSSHLSHPRPKAILKE